ncbi:MAG: vanadium-dependent haloperoxidase [Bacteroidetes bacterium]|nr:vanadium-dependent haloperoxidase [Bacteroidota bacterium]MBS1934113.1 vanadium-dependent haloperoxidase [Bacteroidota bacterium]
MMKKIFFGILFFCAAANAQNATRSFEEDIQPAVFSISKVMMHDVTNPPAASRFYAYCMIGAYEIVSQNNPSLVSLSKLIKNYTPYIITANKGEYNYKIAAAYCIMETGKLILPSGYMLQDDEDEFVKGLKRSNIPENIISQSMAVAQQVAASVIQYSKGDNYNKLSTKLRYTPLKGDQYWFPTPPAYIEAVEPNWRIIRPMFIESSDQFIPPALTPFSKDSASAFYKLAKEVYFQSINQEQEHINIANFWDCNPFTVATSGHMMIGFKKITPGGHWMNIASIASKNAKLNFDNAILVHTMVSLALMDGFISSWDEKYRSNRLRPETYINRYIDVKWVPVLQTPPFPEYTSAHSVISNAAAATLTYLLGDNFPFTDNSEIIYDIPPRNFKSFNAAAAEAAISRLYGGIHYRDGVENGTKEGQVLGAYIVQKIKAAGIKPLVN